MFTRHVIVRLKAEAAPEFTRIIDQEVIPTLRKQKGFLDIITFISPDLTEAVSNSFWESQADAERYHSEQYQNVTQILSPHMETPPKVQTFDVDTSTTHHISKGKAAAA